MSTETQWNNFEQQSERQTIVGSNVDAFKNKTLSILQNNDRLVEKNEIVASTIKSLEPITNESHFGLEVAINDMLNWWNKDKEKKIREDFKPILSMNEVLSYWESMWEDELLAA